MKINRPLLLGLMTLTCAALSLTGTAASLARFSDAAADGGNQFVVGYWSRYYLHNNPTPPTGNTRFVPDLTATTTPPSQARLFNYDRVDCDNRTGRLLVQVNVPNPAITSVCDYVNWLLPVQTVPLAMPAGSAVTARVWSATQSGQDNRTGSLIAYLRDYDPATDTYTEIASATYTGTYALGRTFYERPIVITVGSNHTVPVGHRLELKLECPAATSQVDVMVAYDTTTFASYLTLQ